MSRLFYHVMQDNAGNLLFNVSGTMRVAGSGTLATIYGDEALTVVLPNPMTNHPSFGSFKCFLGPGDYDFYMAKSGYTFETLTSVQGLGTLAKQNANAVAITGGSVTGVTTLGTTGTLNTGGKATLASADVAADLVVFGKAGFGVAADAAYSLKTYADVQIGGKLHVTTLLGVGRAPTLGICDIYYPRASTNGIAVQGNADTGGGAAVLFANAAGATVGYISTTSSATTYGTSSDVRLKYAIEKLVGSLDRIRLLNPVSFLWRADGSPGIGFVAHELQAVVPEAVTGETNAVNEDGSIRPQQADYAKIVPWLCGAVQELSAQVQVLTARLGALEPSAAAAD